MSSVTENCIAQIMAGHQVPDPCVQIMSVKPIKGPQSQPTAAERYRMSISDGTHSSTVMLATQCNPAIVDGTVCPKAIVRISKYIINEVRGKRIVIVLEMEVTSGPLDHILGQPTDFESPANGGGAPQQQYQQPPPQQQQYKQEPPRQQQYQQPPPQESHYEGEDISSKPLLPIKLLNPYRQSWTIKGRCTYKSPIKTYNTDRGSGTVARVHLLGEDGGEIEATLWRDALDRFYESFVVGSVYYISKATVKQANKRYSNVNNDYAITIEMSSVVQPANDDGNIKTIVYNFVSIADAGNMNENTNVDVCGILTEVGEATPLTTKAGKDTHRRNVKLADQSGSAIELTLWGDSAIGMNFDNALHHVLAIKGARVTTFNGKSLSSGFSSVLELSPDVAECNALKEWYDAQGGQVNFAQISERRGGEGGGAGSQEPKTIAQMKHEAQLSDAATYYTVKMTVALFRKEQNVYPACGSEKCNKKVHQNGDTWRCEPCDANWETPNYRYILSCNCSDHTGSQWVSCFDEVGKQLLRVDAATLESYRDEPAYESIFHDASFQAYKFRIRAKSEMYQDEAKMKYTVARVTPMDFEADTADLINEINKYG